MTGGRAGDAYPKIKDLSPLNAGQTAKITGGHEAQLFAGPTACSVVWQAWTTSCPIDLEDEAQLAAVFGPPPPKADH